MASGTQSDRLDRIENKLDKLSEAIISLARAEEKIRTRTIRSQLFYIRRTKKIRKLYKENHRVNFVIIL